MLVLTPPPQGSQGLAVVLSCLEEIVILVVGVVPVASVLSGVGVATCAHIKLMLPASCGHKQFEMYCVVYYADNMRENCPRAN
jgi:hypothetical protein